MGGDWAWQQHHNLGDLLRIMSHFIYVPLQLCCRLDTAIMSVNNVCVTLQSNILY